MQRNMLVSIIPAQNGQVGFITSGVFLIVLINERAAKRSDPAIQTIA
jgi:hypothetical protein